MALRLGRSLALGCALTALVSSVTALASVDAGAVATTLPWSAARTQAPGPAARQTSSVKELPLGGTTIFPTYFLVAYYGTAGSSALGVLGEGRPGEMTAHLRKSARPFAASGKTVQIVYELIVSVADAHPGADGTYSHYIPRTYVERFVRLARREKALLVLDLQPGRQSFVPQARHFRWALREPFVGLALDPEWRMGPRQVPARTIGHVGATEVNHVSRFVAGVVRARHLPEKIFMVHQFRREMVNRIDQVRARRGLAMVQHIDGFGTRREKLDTYHHVAEPRRFRMGFKLFYDEDTDLFRPREVLRIRPRISYVSYQ